jgi:hypothetical protein
MDCGVCLDTKVDTEFTTLPCNHKVCNECFPRIKVPVCPFCRAKYGNNNSRYYDEIDDEFELDFDILYFSDNDSYETSRTNRRRRRRRYQHSNARQRPRQIASSVPINIFIIGEPQELESEGSEENKTKIKRVFKRNENKRNKKNNSWNHRNLQTNISQSY